MNTFEKNPRQISLERANVLKSRIEPYLNSKEEILTGLYLTEKIKARQLYLSSQKWSTVSVEKRSIIP